jgi:hypothetical protein
MERRLRTDASTLVEVLVRLASDEKLSTSVEAEDAVKFLLYEKVSMNPISTPRRHHLDALDSIKAVPQSLR